MKKTENYLRTVCFVIFSNKLLIVGTVAAMTALAVLISLYFPPTYEITGSLVVKTKKLDLPPESDQSDMVIAQTVLPPDATDTLLELKVVTSYDLILASVEELYAEGAFEDTEPPTALKRFLVKRVKPTYKWLKAALGVVPIPETQAIALDIQERMKAEVFPGSNVVDVSLLYGDPVLGARILNTIFAHYQRFRADIFNNPGSLEFYQTQLGRYETELTSLEGKYFDFLKEWNIADAEAEINNGVEVIRTLSTDLVALEDKILEKNRAIKYGGQVLADYTQESQKVFRPFPYDFGDLAIQKFSDRYDALLFEYLDALKTYDRGSAKVAATEEAIRSSRDNLLYLVRSKIVSENNELAGLQVTAAEKRAERQRLVNRHQKLTEAKAVAMRFQTDMDLRRGYYQNFFKRLEEDRVAQMSQIAQMANAQVLSSAAVPPHPLFPRPMMVIPVGAMVGFLLAFSLGFIREYFGHTFQTPAHVQENLGLPIIGSIASETIWGENRAYRRSASARARIPEPGAEQSAVPAA